MNTTNFTLMLLLFSSISCNAQSFERIQLTQKDTVDLYINDGNNTDLFYLKLVPNTEIRGAIVLLPPSGETLQDLIKQVELPYLAFDMGIATIIPSINWGTEDRMEEIKLLNNIFESVVKDHNIPKNKFVLGGLSNGGMISLTYTQHAVRNHNTTFLKPKGVFGLDVPLDKTHLYQYCEREIKRNHSKVGVNEARWIINNYNQIYGGSPKEYPEKYIENSIYSYGVEKGGNAKYLREIPIRMYTDLDVDWLLNERKRDLYDWNGTDIVAMVNDLKLMGNKNATVIITMGQGFRLDGTKHPHSWSIMDNQDCIEWIDNLFRK